MIRVQNMGLPSPTRIRWRWWSCIHEQSPHPHRMGGAKKTKTYGDIDDMIPALSTLESLLSERTGLLRKLAEVDAAIHRLHFAIMVHGISSEGVVDGIPITSPSKSREGPSLTSLIMASVHGLTSPFWYPDIRDAVSKASPENAHRVKKYVYVATTQLIKSGKLKKVPGGLAVV